MEERQHSKGGYKYAAIQKSFSHQEHPLSEPMELVSRPVGWVERMRDPTRYVEAPGIAVGLAACHRTESYAPK